MLSIFAVYVLSILARPYLAKARSWTPHLTMQLLQGASVMQDLACGAPKVSGKRFSNDELDVTSRTGDQTSTT